MSYLVNEIRSNPYLSSTTKLFLHTVASYADHEGICYPSQRTIAAAMSVSSRTVKRCLRECLELKLLEVRRRWKRSNVYKLLCIKEFKNSTMGTPLSQENRPHSLIKQRLGTAITQGAKTWKEIRAILEDISEVMGDEIAARNRGWFTTIARCCSWESIQTALHVLKCRMLEAQVGGEDTIRNPSGWLTWALRQAGQPI